MVNRFYSKRFCSVLVASLAAFLICFSGLSFAAEYKLVQPVALDDVLSGITITPVTAKEKYITQIGVIAIPANAVELCAQMTKGDILQLGFFAKSAYSVTVQSVTRHNNGVVSVRGTAEGQDMQTFVFSVGTEGFVITMQVLGKHKLYRVAGNTRKGQGVVREFDLRKMPPSFDLPALVPPVDAKTSKERRTP